MPGEADAPCSRHCPDRLPRASARPVPHQPGRARCQNRVEESPRGPGWPRRRTRRTPFPARSPPRHRPSVARQREDAFLTETGNRQPELGMGGGKWLGWGCPRGHGRLPQPQQHPKNAERRSSSAQPTLPRPPSSAKDGTGTPSLAGGWGRDRVTPSRDSPGGLLTAEPSREPWPCRTSWMRLNP